MSNGKLRLVETVDVEQKPSPTTPEARKREVLSDVISALDVAARELGDLDPWKWACIGIRRRMALTLASSFDDVCEAFEPHLQALRPLPPDQLRETSAG